VQVVAVVVVRGQNGKIRRRRRRSRWN